MLVGKCLFDSMATINVILLLYGEAQLGYRSMHLRLRLRYGINIPRYGMIMVQSLYCSIYVYCRDVVAEMLSAVDPVGVSERARRRLIRRHYRIKVWTTILCT